MLWPSRTVLVVGIMGAMFVTDIGSKWLVQNVVMQPPRVIPVLPFFNLTLGFNTGVSFGIGRDFFDAYPLVLPLFKLCVTAGLLVWAVLANARMERIGLALIGGGALGNAFDRWRQGAVTDFLDLHWEGWHWPTFNLADVGIVGGAAMVVIATTLSPVHVRSQS
ncbi:MAG: signal peptidase II [Microcystis sp. LE19-4.1E]|jgi:signal peptidase II|nr:signal peptidase II [Microcystis sp. LE19-4.1E]